MRTSRIATLFVAAIISVAGLADAKLAVVSGQPAKAHFHASGPAGLAIDGNTDEVSASDDGTTIKVVVALGKLDSGVALRNDHMRNKYLEVAKFPSATLTVARSALKFPADGSSTSGDAAGVMNIHGKDKNVTFHYTAQRTGATFKVFGTVPLTITDFGINVPSYLGVTVKPDIAVDVSFSATDA